MSNKTIYAAMLAAGVPIDHHASDLYVKDTPITRGVLQEYPDQCRSTFRSQIDDERWIDLPFAFDSFWEARR
jgi:hypothetical protein